jgi:hypothetical protein
MCLNAFFSEWDAVEGMFPWGVEVLSPFLSGFGVAPSLCEEVDTRLLLDLMTQIRPNIRRIKVEGRHSQTLFWVHVVLRCPFVVVSYQRHPNAPIERSMSVLGTPNLIIACILALHRWVLVSKATGVYGCSYLERAPKFQRRA